MMRQVALVGRFLLTSIVFFLFSVALATGLEYGAWTVAARTMKGGSLSEFATTLNTMEWVSAGVNLVVICFCSWFVSARPWAICGRWACLLPQAIQCTATVLLKPDFKTTLSSQGSGGIITGLSVIAGTLLLVFLLGDLGDRRRMREERKKAQKNMDQKQVAVGAAELACSSGRPLLQSDVRS